MTYIFVWDVSECLAMTYYGNYKGDSSRIRFESNLISEEDCWKLCLKADSCMAIHYNTRQQRCFIYKHNNYSQLVERDHLRYYVKVNVSCSKTDENAKVNDIHKMDDTKRRENTEEEVDVKTTGEDDPTDHEQEPNEKEEDRIDDEEIGAGEEDGSEKKISDRDIINNLFENENGKKDGDEVEKGSNITYDKHPGSGEEGGGLKHGGIENSMDIETSEYFNIHWHSNKETVLKMLQSQCNVQVAYTVISRDHTHTRLYRDQNE